MFVVNEKCVLNITKTKFEEKCWTYVLENDIIRF